MTAGIAIVVAAQAEANRAGAPVEVPFFSGRLTVQPNTKALRRFFAKVTHADDGCWLWNASIDTTGYGKFYDGSKSVHAHRWAYLNLVGPIPEKYDIDHLCRVRACCNPAHLEAVTRRENLMRGDTLIAAHAAGRDCGHARCRSCGLLRDWIAKQRERAAS